MLVHRKKHFIIFIMVFFSWVGIANASVIINEVQLSPTENRFVELYNSGSSSVDLTNWYIQRKTATGSDFGSLVSKTYFEGKRIGAGSYFVISKSSMENSDIVYPSLTLTESNTIQLKNSAGVVDKVGWGDVNDCENVCAPNPSEGKSIQRTSGGNWFVSSSTSGASNSETSSSDDSTDNTGSEVDNDTNTSDISASDSVNDNPAVLKITTKIIAPKIATAGIPFTINSLTTTNKGETYAVGKSVWNFGDGSVKEVGKSDPFEYVYDYPGEYVVTLSYFDSYFSKVADASDRMTIKVVATGIKISSVGTTNDPFIEIENKSSYEIVLSNWIVTAGIHYFKIPEGTTILPNKKIKLSPKITGFIGEDLNSVIIANANKEMIATYPVITKQTIQKSPAIIIAVNANKVLSENAQSKPLPLEESQIINLNDLGSSAGDTASNISNPALYPIIGLFVVIGIGVAAFLLLKKKREPSDYIEKEIRAEDMTIIE